MLDGQTGALQATASVPPSALAAVSNFMPDGQIPCTPMP
jgi:hypothetical protein